MRRIVYRVTIYIGLIMGSMLLHNIHSNVFAADTVDPVLKIVIFNLKNKTENKKNDYYSRIVPENISLSLQKTGKYVVETSSTILDVAQLNDENYSAYIELLGDQAEDFSADYVITGEFYTSKKQIVIDCNVYITRLDKIVKVDTSKKDISVFLNELIDELSTKIALELDKYRQKKTDAPLFLPPGGVYRHDVKISITSVIQGAEIRYTLDGSDPKEENARTYTGPFSLDDSLTVKAQAFKSGWKPSDIAEQHYKIKYPISNITIGGMYGVLDFLDDEDATFEMQDSQYAMLFAYWELANISSIRGIPFLRDFALIVKGDLGHAKSNDELAPVHRNFWGGTFGLLYKLRIFRFLSIDLHGGGGYYYSQETSDDIYEKKNFFRPTDEVDKESDFYFSGTGVLNINLGPIFLVGGATYFQLYHDGTSDTTKLMAYHGGGGIRF